MKELEALEYLYKGAREGTPLHEIALCDDCKNIIKKALTPPTEEEVCRQLSEYIKRPIEYYAPAKQFVIRCSNGYHEISRLHGTNEISFDTTYCLPPHLITLIGRFYEGLEK